MNGGYYFFKRLLWLPLIALLIHFLSYGYALFALQVQLSQNPWGYGADRTIDILSTYGSYLKSILRFNFGLMPGGTTPIIDAVLQAGINSLGLLMIAFIISSLFGLAIGFAAARTEPTSIAPWLIPLSTIGLATPSFFIGTLFIVGTLYYIFVFGQSSVQTLPLSGFGWDEHLVFPLLAISCRPIAQIAQSTAKLLTSEFGKQYVVAARSIGNTWRRIRRKHSLRNVLAPIIITISNAFRFLLAELILVEWIFNWPGLGRLLALTLIPPKTSTVGGFGSQPVYFLHPELLATILTFFGVVFFLMDSVFSFVARRIDPRIRKVEEQEFYE